MAEPADSGHGGDHATLLRAPIAGSLTTDPKLFGVAPGGLPWKIAEGTARARSDGTVNVEVRGLVVTTAGTNPVPMLAASVVCNGTVAATTSAVPFSPQGNAEIRADVTLPGRCLAPAVLLSPNGLAGVFIGATGSAS